MRDLGLVLARLRLGQRTRIRALLDPMPFERVRHVDRQPTS
jgi:hypothetical protein